MNNFKKTDFLFNQVVQPEIKIFYYLFKLGSFSKAAALLGVSQPTITRRISLLENSLGVGLIDRDVRPIRFTREGRELFKLIEQELFYFNDSVLSLSKISSSRIPFRFGCVGSVAAHLCAQVINSVAKDISTIQVFNDDSVTLRKRWEEDKIDIFISSRPFFECRSLHRAFLFSEPAVLVLPKELNAEAPVTWDYLRFCGLPRVSNFIGTSNGDFETEYLTKLGLNFVDKIMVEQPLPLLSCIANGLAWGILDPTTIALFPNLHDKLAFFPLPEHQPCRELFVLSRNEEIFRSLADTVLATAGECLTELVRNKISGFAPWVPQMCWVPASETQQRIRVVEP